MTAPLGIFDIIGGHLVNVIVQPIVKDQVCRAGPAYVHGVPAFGKIVHGGIDGLSLGKIARVLFIKSIAVVLGVAGQENLFIVAALQDGNAQGRRRKERLLCLHKLLFRTITTKPLS